MTLVELLVVIIILGLLGVAAAPAINSSGSKTKLRDAAASVSSHLVRASSQAVGRTAGHGAWLEPGSNGANIGTRLLRFCPGIVEASGTATLTIASLSASSAGASLTPSYQALTGTTAVPAGSLFRITGMPYDYFLISGTTVSFTGASAANSWPRPAAGNYPGTVTAPFTLQVPPMRPGVGKTLLPGSACVDLPQSTVGVYSYSPSVSAITNSGPLIITFDRVGRPKSVVFTGTSGSASLVSVDALVPVALLIGFQDQVGAAPAAAPSDENPGTNWQRKDAWWVVVDPRTGSIFQVENYPNATSLPEAQKFIRQRLLNRKNAN